MKKKEGWRILSILCRLCILGSCICFSGYWKKGLKEPAGCETNQLCKQSSTVSESYQVWHVGRCVVVFHSLSRSPPTSSCKRITWERPCLSRATNPMPKAILRSQWRWRRIPGWYRYRRFSKGFGFGQTTLGLTTADRQPPGTRSRSRRSTWNRRVFLLIRALCRCLVDEVGYLV